MWDHRIHLHLSKARLLLERSFSSCLLWLYELPVMNSFGACVIEKLARHKMHPLAISGSELHEQSDASRNLCNQQKDAF